MSPSPSSALQRCYPGLRFSPFTAARLAGFVPVLLVLAIIILAYITAVPATLLPLRTIHPFLVYPLLLLFHFIYLNVLANYTLLVLADPGATPDDWKAPPPPPVTRSTRPRPHPPAVRQPARLAFSTVPACPDPPDDDEAEQLLHRPPEHAPAAKPAPTVFRHAHLMRERSFNGSLRYCHECTAYKPDRAHHCSVCRRCILRMDHHCVFVNNCVSFFNHKFFISFVTYAFVGCLFVAVVAFPTFTAVLSTSPRLIKPPRNPGKALQRVFDASLYFVLGALRRAKLSEYANMKDMSPALKTLALVGYITSAAFAFALAIFVGLHFYLISKGRTTIEMYELTDSTRTQAVLEYDLGVAKNFRNVFGTVPLYWFLPTRAYVEGDGLTYERRILPDRAAFAV